MPKLRINPERKEAFLGKNRLTLTHLEYEILEILHSRDRLWRRAEILDNIFENDEGLEKDFRVVDWHIHQLRKKIGFDRIECVWRMGYKLSRVEKVN